MNQAIPVHVIATAENFDEFAYLSANPDVKVAVTDSIFKSGRQHFDLYGHREARRLYNGGQIDPAREKKMRRLKPHLRDDMVHEWRDGKVSYLTENLRASAGISATDRISSMGYDPFMLEMFTEYASGLVLDSGAGSKGEYFDNVINFEIVDYPSTDVLGVGESLPFRDNAFDGIISIAVLEHVRDPFRCASELCRVLKPGGKLYCAMPFLQPYHGYPHHYFNATAQGVRRLFEDSLQITRQDVLEGMKPIATLQWILNAWKENLSDETADEFMNMTVRELLTSPNRLSRMPFCAELSQEKIFELACATVLWARKG